MLTSDAETVIVLNRADRAEGWFSFGTAIERDFNKLCRRVGGRENLIEVRECVQDGKVTWWQCKVPIRYLSRAGFGIRNPKSGRVMPPKSLLALQKWRAVKDSDPNEAGG